MITIEPHARLILDNRILIINGSEFGINCWIHSDELRIEFIKQGKRLSKGFWIDIPSTAIIAIDKEYTCKIFKEVKSKYGIDMEKLIRVYTNIEVSVSHYKTTYNDVIEGEVIDDTYRCKSLSEFI